MNINIKTALIAATVALVTSILSGFLTLYKIEQDKEAWLSDTFSANLEDLYKVRLEKYPELHKLIGFLSSKQNDITPESCSLFADSLNQWYYSEGLILSSKSRRAVLSLRNKCYEYASGKHTEFTEEHIKLKQQEIQQLRELTHVYLRADLNLDTDNILYTDLSQVELSISQALKKREEINNSR